MGVSLKGQSTAVALIGDPLPASVDNREVQPSNSYPAQLSQSEMAKVCLIVIDGWGISDADKGALHLECFFYLFSLLLCIGNAIKNAETPVMDRLAQVEGEYTTLDASGNAVGLPAGLMGNSEVGHFTIGTGRVVFQVREILQFCILCDFQT